MAFPVFHHSFSSEVSASWNRNSIFLCMVPNTWGLFTPNDLYTFARLDSQKADFNVVNYLVALIKHR